MSWQGAAQLLHLHNHIYYKVRGFTTTNLAFRPAAHCIARISRFDYFAVQEQQQMLVCPIGHRPR